MLIAGTVFGSYHLAGMYGIALAAIGMLGNLCICLAIDGFGPIADNAGGLATRFAPLAGVGNLIATGCLVTNGIIA